MTRRPTRPRVKRTVVTNPKHEYALNAAMELHPEDMRKAIYKAMWYQTVSFHKWLHIATIEKDVSSHRYKVNLHKESELPDGKKIWLPTGEIVILHLDDLYELYTNWLEGDDQMITKEDLDLVRMDF